MTRLALALCLFTAVPVHAQESPKFEVASVKRVEPSGPPGDMPRNLDPAPGHLTMKNAPLRHAILWAYDLKDYQISGPDWIANDMRYDIIAKAAGPVPEDQVRLMLRALLTERFGIKMHRETRQLSVYVLEPNKGEPKVTPASANAGQPTINGTATGATFHNQPIGRFTFMLTRRMDRPVLDYTGLKGSFDYTVDLSGLGFNGRPAEDPNAPSIFTTVQRDLNLKLEARKAPVEFLVIDRANKVPIEN